MTAHVLVWDLEAVPDLRGFAAANGLDGKSDDEIRAARMLSCGGHYGAVTEHEREAITIRTGLRFDYALFKGETPRGHTEFGSREELRHGRRKRHGGAHSRTRFSYLDSRRATRRPG